MTSNKPRDLSKQKIAQIMVTNAQEAILIATDEGTTRERGHALWRARRLFEEVSKLGALPSLGQAQTA
ncbi:MAG: hypothetical protein Q7S86_00940 [bacterium]|nr:hypothetical protein [bacterium]